MSKRFKTGFIVGKFAPLHRGHCHLIDSAWRQCEQLWILSYSQPELLNCEPARRLRWLSELVPRAQIIVLDTKSIPQPLQALGWTQLPDNGAAPDVHRQLCADACLALFGGVADAVFSSESYGEALAKTMSEHFTHTLNRPHRVTHFSVDYARTKLPISATQIRSDLHANRNWLPPQVYADFVQRACFLGAESTGKSTLCNLTAQRLDTCYVPEYGRTLWETQNGKLSFTDMLKIAATQIQMEADLAAEANKWLICDTSPLTTTFYSDVMFQRIDPQLAKLAHREYHHIFLCASDFPLVQDGTRQNEAFRQQQHEWYLRELSERKVDYTLLTGSLDSKLNTATDKLAAQIGAV